MKLTTGNPQQAILLLDDKFDSESISSLWKINFTSKQLKNNTKPFQVIATYDSNNLINDQNKDILINRKVSLYDSPYYNCVIFENHFKEIIEKVGDGNDGTLIFVENGKILTNLTMKQDICEYIFKIIRIFKTQLIWKRYEKNGIVYKCLAYLFEMLNKKSNYSFKVELLQFTIYLESISDSSKSWNDANQKILIRSDSSDIPYLISCQNQCINNLEEIVKEFENAHLNILQDITNNSKKSSRMIFACQLFVEQTNLDDGKVVKSCLEMFDITCDDTFKARENIRVYLYECALDSVSSALKDKRFVPYRDSILTRLMKNCLMGTSFTAALFDNFKNIRLVENFSHIRNQEK